MIYRIEQSLGRNSIVGTTIRNPADIPQQLGADEKHTRILGDTADATLPVLGLLAREGAVFNSASIDGTTSATLLKSSFLRLFEPY